MGDDGELVGIAPEDLDAEIKAISVHGDSGRITMTLEFSPLECLSDVLIPLWTRHRNSLPSPAYSAKSACEHPPWIPPPGSSSDPFRGLFPSDLSPLPLTTLESPCDPSPVSVTDAAPEAIEEFEVECSGDFPVVPASPGLGCEFCLNDGNDMSGLLGSGDPLDMPLIEDSQLTSDRCFVHEEANMEAMSYVEQHTVRALCVQLLCVWL